MFYFLVSGYIPGTNYQLTFDIFLIVAGMVVCAILFMYLVKSTVTTLRSNAVSMIQYFDEIAL